jgi:hypothetical protein
MVYRIAGTIKPDYVTSGTLVLTMTKSEGDCLVSDYDYRGKGIPASSP